MINHHPNEQVLQAFAAGELPASVSVAVSIHVEMCEHCRNKVQMYTEQLAQNSLQDDVLEESSDLDLDAMLDAIMEDDSKDLYPAFVNSHIQINDTKLNTPSALQSLTINKAQSIGKLTRSRIELDDDEIRSSILHIDAGGDIPSHTHNGFEVTVLLDGSFEDEMGTYNKGDFIWLDGEHTHNPVTKDGCVCYAVVSDALHFNQGISRLLNPIGKLIY